MINLNKFDNVYTVDFEYTGVGKLGESNGNRPIPVCCAVHELHSGVATRYWQEEIASTPPFDTGERSLFVGYSLTAEFSCFHVLGWPCPANVLDLFAETMLLYNGVMVDGEPVRGRPFNLVRALALWGLPALDAGEKQSWIETILRGAPWTDAERKGILDYCERDVQAETRLLNTMAEHIDEQTYGVRGAYQYALAGQIHRGIPMDVEALNRVRSQWEQVRNKLIDSYAGQYPFFSNYHFVEKKFAEWVNTLDIVWPTTPSGKFARDKDTLEALVDVYPSLNSFRELMSEAYASRELQLLVGDDGRNRCHLYPFGSKTSRNQPSSTKFVYGGRWWRSLIRPPEGYALAYLDFEQEEFAIAAYLSKDPAMIHDYEAGDPYLGMGKSVGLIPKDGTKASHPLERNMCKTLNLAILYGMGAESLSHKLKCSEDRAQEILDRLKEVYHVYFAWSASFVEEGRRVGWVGTPYGWRLLTTGQSTRSLQNFPMQARGADILRVACILLEEARIEVVAPVHDAVLVQAKLDTFNEVTEQSVKLMVKASELVLGHPLRVEKGQEVLYPSNYVAEKGGDAMWQKIRGMLT
jgi:hypothetical protein